VVTSRARSKIKHFVQGEERRRSIELGHRLFEKEARRFDLNARTLAEGEAFRKFAGDWGTPDEVFADLGYGKLSPRKLLAKLVPQEQLQEKAPATGVTSLVRRVFGSGDAKIKVHGVDDLMVYRARCCNPIRGEAIVGYVTRGKGVSVHAASCTNVVNLLYDPERRIEVEWDKAADSEPYTVRLTMRVEDRKGILADVSSTIADINTNITNVEATTGEDTHARIDLTVEIRDLKHLQRIMKSLRAVDGVLEVERTVARAG
jgi:GTP diphosphokinase / guanosine-3',5'-bis(diphosphate) 3'-diphosphatase